MDCGDECVVWDEDLGGKSLGEKYIPGDSLVSRWKEAEAECSLDG